MFKRSVIKPILFGMLAFLTSWGAARIYGNWDALKQMYLEANLARYQAMTYEGEGPAQYYVVHNDFSALKNIAVIEADILNVEKSSFDSLAKLSVTSAYSGALDRLREHDAVSVVMSTSIPLLCH